MLDSVTIHYPNRSFCEQVEHHLLADQFMYADGLSKQAYERIKEMYPIVMVQALLLVFKRARIYLTVDDKIIHTFTQTVEANEEEDRPFNPVLGTYSRDIGAWEEAETHHFQLMNELLEYIYGSASQGCPAGHVTLQFEKLLSVMSTQIEHCIDALQDLLDPYNTDFVTHGILIPYTIDLRCRLNGHGVNITFVQRSARAY